MGLGAYVSGVLAKHFGVTPWITLIVAALVAALLGITSAIAPSLSLLGEWQAVQGDWVTVTVCPATVIVPVRSTPLVFGATVY